MANSDLLDYSKSSNKPIKTYKETQQTISSTSHSSRSRQRWQLLSKAVRLKQFDLQELMKSYQGSSSSSSKDSFNQQSDPLTLIETYGLVNYCYESSNSPWIKCQWNKKWNQLEKLNLDIKLVHNRLHVKDLAGFDNSGNVRIWSSEEVLGYLLANGFLRSKLNGRIICELGAGMTGLAGLVCARLGLHRELYLTDGNERCVRNIREIVQRNFPENCLQIPKNGPMKTQTKNIYIQKLCWNQFGDYQNLKNHIETIICADCLFCSEAHQHLINTINHLLVVDEKVTTAQAFIMAPRRGDKLDRFIARVFEDGRFLLQVYESYDRTFSEMFDRLREHDPQRYDPDTCYPYLLVMKRLQRTNYI